jgi:hypothetical protein
MWDWRAVHMLMVTGPLVVTVALVVKVAMGQLVRRRVEREVVVGPAE